MAEKFLVNVDVKARLDQASLYKIQDDLRKAAAGALSSFGQNISPDTSKLLSNIADGLDKVSKNTVVADKRLEKFGAHITSYFTRFAGFTLAASTVFKLISSIDEASDAAVEFDTKMTRLRQITGDSRTVLKELSDEIFRLSTSLGVSQKELSNASETLAQAGYNTTQTKQALEALAKASVAPTFKDMDETTDGLLATLKQFNLQTSDSTRVLSQLNAVSAAYAVESSDLIKAIQRTGGVFAQSGTSLEEFLALFTAVRSTTREAPETIAQGLKTIITRIQRVKTSEYLERLGIRGIRDETTKEFVGAFDAIQALSQQVTRLGKRSPEIAAIIEELGGTRQIGKVLPLLNNFKVAQEALQVALSGTNSLSKDAAIAQESLQVQFNKTKEELTKLLVTFANNEDVREFIKDISQTTQSLISLANALQPILPALLIIGGSRVVLGASKIARGAINQVKTGNFATGGYIPGRSTKDDYPALLMRGEYVVSQKGVDTVGTEFLDMINSGAVPRFAKGGRKDYRKTVGVQRETEQELKKILLQIGPKDLFRLSSNPALIDQFRQQALETVISRNVISSLPLENRSFSLREFGKGPKAFEQIINSLSTLPLNAQDLISEVVQAPSSAGYIGKAYPTGKLAFNLSKNQGSTVVAHEVGHLVQEMNRPNATGQSFQDRIAELLAPVRAQQIAAAKKSGNFSVMALRSGKTEQDLEKYLSSPQEIFADFYSAQGKDIQQILGSTADPKVGMERLLAKSGGRPFENRLTSIGEKKVLPQNIASILGNTNFPLRTENVGEGFSKYRAQGLTPQEAIRKAREDSVSIRGEFNRRKAVPDPINNLTLEEKKHLLPLLKQEQLIQGRIIKQASERETILSRLTDKTKELASKFSNTSIGGGIGRFFGFGIGGGAGGGAGGAGGGAGGGAAGGLLGRNSRRRFARGVGIASVGALLATQSDLFQNAISSTSSAGGAAVSGALQGGVTGLAVGANFGPVAAALSGVAGAAYGVVDSLRKFREATLESELAISQKKFNKTPTSENLSKIIEQTTALGLSKAESQTSYLDFVTQGTGGLSKEKETEALSKTLLTNDIGNTIREFIRQQVLGGKISSVKDVEKLSFNVTGRRVTSDKIDESLKRFGFIRPVTKTASSLLALEQGSSKEEVKKQLALLIESNKQEKKKIDLGIKYEASLLSLNESVNKFSANIFKMSDNLPDTNIKTLGSSSSFLKDFSGLNKPGSASFGKAVGGLPVGLQGVGNSFNKVTSALRNTLSTVDPTQTSAEYIDEFTKSLEKQLGGGFENVINSIVNVLNDEDDFSKFAENVKRDINKPLQDLLSSSGLSRVGDSLRDFGSEFARFQADLLQRTSELFSASSSLIDSRISSGASALSNRRAIAGITGASTVAGLDNRNVTGSISGAFGTADPSKLAGFVKNFDALAKATGDGRYVEASKYVIDALKRLGDVSSRTGDIFTRLNEVQSSRQAKIGLREAFITGDAASRRSLSTNLSAAKTFAETGGTATTFSLLTPAIQKAVIEGLRAFGAGTVGGTGKTGTRIADEILGAGLPETTEIEKLTASIGKIASESERINAFLTARLAEINSDFLAKYSAINADFLSKFTTVLRGGSFSPVSAGIIPSEATSSFSIGVEKFAAAAAAIPHNIAMNVNHTVEVIHNGAQAFNEMKSSFIDLAVKTVEEKVNELIKTKFPDVGPMP